MKTSWPIKKLGEVANLVRGPFGGSLRKEIFQSDGFCVYEQGNVISGNTSDFRYFISKDKFNEMKRFQVEHGDILMSCSGTIGKLVEVPENFKAGIINQALLKISPRDKIYGKYLLWLLREYFVKNLKHTKGMAIKNIASVIELKQIEIPLPPLDVQKKIVAKLEKLLSKVDEAKKLREKSIESTNKLLSAELHKIFTEGKSKGWEEINIGDPSIMKITSGGTPSKSHPEYYGGDIRWLKSGELNDDTNIIDSEDYITKEAVKKSSAKIFPKHTVLLAMYGATAGKLGILGVESATNQAIAGMICNEDHLDFKYLYYLLGNIRNQIIAKAWGGAQPNLSQTIIKNFKIPLPELSEQKNIVKRLDSLSEKIKKIQEHQSKTAEDLKSLEQSILHQAFSGNLIK